MTEIVEVLRCQANKSLLGQLEKITIFHFLSGAFSALCLQCFDAVGWAAGRASGL